MIDKAVFILPGKNYSQKINFEDGLADNPGFSLEIKHFVQRKTITHNLDTSQKDFEDYVEQALNAIKMNEFKKVVIARQKTTTKTDTFDQFEVLKKMCDKYPNALKFAINSHEYGNWIGATPELVLKKRGKLYYTIALAGTMNSSSSKAWNKKDLNEQQIVVEDIVKNLSKINAQKILVGEAEEMLAGPVKHILSKISFVCNSSPEIIINTIHPTAALCGYPREKAIDFINKIEDFERRLYTGYVTINYPNGDLDTYALIRLMEFDSKQIKIFAGCGITIDSKPANEWLETESKMSTIESLLN